MILSLTRTAHACSSSGSGLGRLESEAARGHVGQGRGTKHRIAEMVRTRSGAVVPIPYAVFPRTRLTARGLATDRVRRQARDGDARVSSHDMHHNSAVALQDYV